MRFSFSLLIFAFVLASVSCKSQPAAPSFSKTAMLADYDSLVAALREAHGGLYRFHNKEEIEKHFLDYRGRISEKVNKYEYIALLMEMLAYLGDGHMRLEYDAATMDAYSKAKTLPLAIQFEDDKPIVLFNDTESDSTIRPGMELIEINGHKMGDIVKETLPKLPHDGIIETGRKRRLERFIGFAYWLFVAQEERFTVTAIDETGKQVKSTLNGITQAVREQSRFKNSLNAALLSQLEKWDEPKQNISHRFVSDGVATLRVRNFVDAGFTEAVDQAIKEISKARVIILDLRGNGGGSDMWGAWLVSKFTNKPFHYFERIHLPTINPSFTAWRAETIQRMKETTTVDPKGGYLATSKLHPGLAIQDPGDINFTGKLIVLADGGTFSTAADVCAQLRNRPNTIFIGEETGGGYSGNTSGTNARLDFRHSGFRVSIHVYDYWNAVPAREIGRGVLPDYTIQKTVKALTKGIDAQWEKAIELSNQ